MRKVSLLMILLLTITLLPSTTWAASPWTTQTTNDAKMSGKLVYGLKNVLFGWVEVIHQPLLGFKDSSGNRLSNGFVGLFRGLGYGVMDEVGGALHLLTFPMLNIDVPLPEDGVDLSACPLRCPLSKK